MLLVKLRAEYLLPLVTKQLAMYIWWLFKKKQRGRHTEFPEYFRISHVVYMLLIRKSVHLNNNSGKKGAFLLKQAYLALGPLLL